MNTQKAWNILYKEIEEVIRFHEAMEDYHLRDDVQEALNIVNIEMDSIIDLEIGGWSK